MITRERRREISRNYARRKMADPQFRRLHSERQRNCYENRPEALRHIRRRAKVKRLSTLNGRIEHNLRCRTYRALRGAIKGGKIWDLIGCSPDNLNIYLQSKFEVGMTWENYGKGEGQWSVDHIIPCSLFDLTRPEHQKICFHFSNLQPMWHVENIRKGNRPPKD